MSVTTASTNADPPAPDSVPDLLRQLLATQQQILAQLTQHGQSLASLVAGLTPFAKE